MSKAKLHEALAVRTSIDGQLGKVAADLKATFTGKHHLFVGKITQFSENKEGVPPVTESQQTVQSTVPKELDWVSRFFKNAIDAGHNINLGNMRAVADLILPDSTILLKGVPATTLLELEKILTAFKSVLETAPTLDPAKGFEKDTNEQNQFKAREIRKVRTKKSKVPIVLFPATDKHPAQTALNDEDVPVGTIVEKEWSGMITPATKADLLENNEVMLRAVKQARSRANDLEIESQKIGAQLIDYILSPITTK